MENLHGRLFKSKGGVVSIDLFSFWVPRNDFSKFVFPNCFSMYICFLGRECIGQYRFSQLTENKRLSSVMIGDTVLGDNLKIDYTVLFPRSQLRKRILHFHILKTSPRLYHYYLFSQMNNLEFFLLIHMYMYICLFTNGMRRRNTKFGIRKKYPMGDISRI